MRKHKHKVYTKPIPSPCLALILFSTTKFFFSIVFFTKFWYLPLLFHITPPRSSPQAPSKLYVDPPTNSLSFVAYLLIAPPTSLSASVTLWVHPELDEMCGCVVIQWNMVDLPRATLLKNKQKTKNNSLYLSSHQLFMTPQLEVEPRESLPPSMLESNHNSDL